MEGVKYRKASDETGRSRVIKVENQKFYRQENEHFSQKMKEELQHLLYLAIKVAMFCSSSEKPLE